MPERGGGERRADGIGSGNDRRGKAAGIQHTETGEKRAEGHAHAAQNEDRPPGSGARQGRAMARDEDGEKQNHGPD